MDIHPAALTRSHALRDFDTAVDALIPAMRDRAAALDQDAAYPHDDIAALHDAGVLLAPFPACVGGQGFGTEPQGAAPLARLLRRLGRGNLAVGRLFEAHVNAVRLIARYGTAAQLRRAAGDAAAGDLIALWVTDPAQGALRADRGVLHGGKAFCSGAGRVPRAVVTATDEGGATRLAYLSTAGAVAAELPFQMQGMRAATTGQVRFDGLPITPQDWIGVAGDYMREPDFSAGAWRTSAVTCGGLEALVDHAMRQLVARGRQDDPHQQARMGRAWIARETARLWVARAAEAAENPGDAAEVIATVNCARIAIETACLDAMRLVERSLGLPAFANPSPVERIRRDLATYLRQPAADEILTDAAAHVMRTRVST